MGPWSQPATLPRPWPPKGRLRYRRKGARQALTVRDVLHIRLQTIDAKNGHNVPHLFAQCHYSSFTTLCQWVLVDPLPARPPARAAVGRIANPTMAPKGHPSPPARAALRCTANSTVARMASLLHRSYNSHAYDQGSAPFLTSDHRSQKKTRLPRGRRVCPQSRPYFFAWTLMVLGLACSDLGMLSVSTPLSNVASALSGTNEPGRRIDRLNAP